MKLLFGISKILKPIPPISSAITIVIHVELMSNSLSRKIPKQEIPSPRGHRRRDPTLSDNQPLSGDSIVIVNGVIISMSPAIVAEYCFACINRKGK